MNILPIATAFIFLFALQAYTLLQRTMATSQETMHFSGAQRIYWNHLNQEQRQLYKTFKNSIPAAKKNEKKPASAPKESEYKSLRTYFNLPESAKLSIASLLREKTPNPKLREVTAKLIRLLYEQTSLYSPHFEDKVLATLIRIGHEHPNAETFQDLFQKVDDEISLYYKLCKGTQSYDLFTSNGYPALGDFLTLANRPPVYMNYASQALLIALFGEIFANQLIEKEKKSWEETGKKIPLKKEEVEALFMKISPNGKNLSDFGNLLDYSQRSRRLSQYVFYDEKSNIQIRVPKC